MSEHGFYNPSGPYVLTETGDRKLGVDFSGGKITIDIAHRKIHKGEFFSTGFTYLDVADLAFVYFRFVTAATHTFHYSISVIAEGKAYGFLYRGTTYTASGTPASVADNNCATNNTPNTTAFSSPTPDVLGTLLTPENGILIPAGLGPQSVGGRIRSAEERVAAADQDYLVAVQNVSGQTKDITLEVAGYEVAT